MRLGGRVALFDASATMSRLLELAVDLGVPSFIPILHFNIYECLLPPVTTLHAERSESFWLHSMIWDRSSLFDHQSGHVSADNSNGLTF